MASQLKKLTDLKRAFVDFEDMSELVGRVKTRVDDINRRNVTAAGDDEIGKQYHEQADKPTAALTTLVTAVRDRLKSIGTAGQDAADMFDAADQDANDLVK
ncbi:hypothetical protein [Kitasatospora sp. KL5]|uniref:hypothetical protein n=1 Tax=Kitasatospora sp. KL5 TaxID=3425125 RepID=UPI003D6F7E0B